jgi:hypothetical protein
MTSPCSNTMVAAQVLIVMVGLAQMTSAEHTRERFGIIPVQEPAWDNAMGNPDATGTVTFAGPSFGTSPNETSAFVDGWTVSIKVRGDIPRAEDGYLTGTTIALAAPPSLRNGTSGGLVADSSWTACVHLLSTHDTGSFSNGTSSFENNCGSESSRQCIDQGRDEFGHWDNINANTSRPSCLSLSRIACATRFQVLAALSKLACLRWQCFCRSLTHILQAPNRPTLTGSPCSTTLGTVGTGRATPLPLTKLSGRGGLSLSTGSPTPQSPRTTQPVSREDMSTRITPILPSPVFRRMSSSLAAIFPAWHRNGLPRLLYGLLWW